MPISGCYRRKGASDQALGSSCASPRPGAPERLRKAAVFGWLAFLAAGCAGTSVQPHADATLDPPPLDISADGTPRRPVHLTSYANHDKSAAEKSGGLGSALSFAPDGDTESYRLPSLELVHDGPIARVFEATNEGPWSPDQAVLPWVEFREDEITVHNIRNALYRTVDDYTVRLYDKTYDLRKLTSVDLIIVPFNDNPSIAHVALSFGFEDRDFLISSVEIRKRTGQTYSAAAGFFNQYTLMYVLTDERDMLWKETLGFSQEVYIYRTKATPKQAQEMFVDVLRRVNKLAREPEFYNTVTNNCTTNVRNHVNHLLPDKVPYDYRVLLPGYAPELAYDLGLIEKHGTFEQTKAAAKVNFNYYLYQDDPDFSRKIRGL